MHGPSINVTCFCLLEWTNLYFVFFFFLEFSFDLSVEDKWQCILFCNYFSPEIRMPLPGPTEARMLGKDWEGNWTVGCSSEADCLLTQLKRQRAIISTRLVYISFLPRTYWFCRNIWGWHGIDHLWNSLESAADSSIVSTSWVELWQDRDYLRKTFFISAASPLGNRQ